MGNQFADLSKIASPISHRRLMTAAVTTLFLFLLSCFSCMDVVHANFLPEPTPKWSFQLLDSGRLSGRGLRRGNAIVASNDGTKIVVTAIDGSLHIIQTANQVKTIAVYEPEGKVGANIECRSGATIVYSEQQNGLYFSVESEEEKPISAKEDFIVYALVDDVLPQNARIVDPDIIVDGINANRGAGTTSRVVAVNMEGALKWSVDVPGRIEGSPLVGKNGIYITHNHNGYGALSILRIQPKDGRAAIAAMVSNRDKEQIRAIPFGPPTLRKAAYWEDESDSEDIVIVAENWESGFSESKGGLYMLSSGSISATKDKDKPSTTKAGSNKYELVQLSSWSYSAIAPPLVYGDSIFVGAAGGTIGGFTGNRKNDLSGITSGREEEISPRWFYQVSPNPRNSSQPIRSQPAMDSEGEYLCLSGVNRDFYCLQSDTGRLLWRAQEGSEILARPHIFGGEEWRKVVYVIETQNGRVHQYDLYSGRSYWDYSCSEISEDFCQDAVEAEFAIAPNGNTIYYGDIYGRINSLQVASFTTETPTIAPTFEPTRNLSESPTNTPSPTVGEYSSQVAQDASSTPSVAEKSSDWIIIDGDIGQQSQQEGGTDKDNLGPIVEDSISSNTGSAAIVDQQPSKIDSDKLIAYIGAAIAGLCVMMIPILIFSMLRRRRKKSTSSRHMVVEAVDGSSSDDVESQADINYFNSIETNNNCDAGNGDSIEVEIINRSNPLQTNSTKMKGKSSLPDTPDTIQSLESIDEAPKDASAMVVVGKEYDVADPSVEAVNLRQTFDRAVDSQAVTPGDVCPDTSSNSNHREGSIRNVNIDKNKEKVNGISYFSDDDVPPPPPLEDGASSSSTSKEWTWGSLLEIGTSQSFKKQNDASQILLKKPSENLQLNQSAYEISSSQEESSTPVSTGSQKVIPTKEEPQVPKKVVLPIKKKRWGKKSKMKISTSSIEYGNDSIEHDQVEIPAAMKQKAECQTLPRDELTEEIAPEQVFATKDESKEREEVTEELFEEPVTNATEEENQVHGEPHTGTESLIPPPQTPHSPSTYLLLSDAVQTLSPVRSLQSVQSLSSPNHSYTKSVESDDDSLYTTYTGGTVEKKQDAKNLSPLSNFIYDQDVYRRGRSDIVNEGKRHLAQPVMSKSYTGSVLDEHPDDESVTAPGNQYLSEDVNGPKYGRSVRSKQDSNSFKSSSTSGSEFGHKPLAQMYDQLAAIGQQRREQRKPGFKRRSRRAEQENSTPSQQEMEQRGDTWGNFLNELADAEQQFFSPSTGKNKSLLSESGSEDIEDT